MVFKVRIENFVVELGSIWC